MSRARRSGLSLVSGVGSSAVTLMLGLVATPLLLRWLGDERFGAYRVALEWVGYLVLLDFGLAGALQAATSRRLGEGDRVGALAGVRRGMKRFAAVAVLQMVGVGAFALFADSMIENLSGEVLWELRWGLAIACIMLAWSPLYVLRPLLDSAQQSYWVNLAVLAQGVGMTLFALLFAWAGWGLIGQFAAFVVGSTIYTLIMLRIVASRHPDLWTTATSAEVLPLIDWPMSVFNVVGRIGVLSDGIILGAMLGTPAVVVYFVTQRFLQVVLVQIYGIGNSSWAALAELHHRGELEIFRNRFLQLNRMTLILGVAAFGPIAILNKSLVGLWVGDARYGGDELTWATFAQVLLMAVLAFWIWPFFGTGKIRSTIAPMVLGSAVNVAVSIWGTHQFGVVGPALGTVLGYGLVFLPWFAYLLHREFGVSRSALLIEVPKSLALFAPVGASLYLLAQWLNIDEWTPLRWPRFTAYCLLAMATGIFYLMLAYRLLLPAAERVEWRGRMPGQLKRILGST